MRVLLLAATLVAAALAGCASPNDDASPQERATLADWETEARLHGPMGVPASFDLQGSPLVVSGLGVVSVVASPVTILPGEVFGSGDRRILYVRSATVEGKGTGLLALEGREIRMTAGSIRDLGIARASVGAHVEIVPATESHAADVTFPPDWDGADNGLFFARATTAEVKGATFEGYDRAVLVTAGGNHTLGASVTADANGFYLDEDTAFRAGSLSMEFARFALGGNVTAGELKPEGRSAVAAPKGVFGFEATLRVAAGRAASEGPFRLTQALTADGYLFRSTVEILPAATAVTVAKDGTEWVRVQYREKSYLGDAVLGEVKVTGAGAAAVKVPVEKPPLLVQHLFEQASGIPGPGGLVFAAGVALASPALVWIDVLTQFGCLVSLCPEQYPFPQWMDAGARGTFYVKVEGALAPGTYDATVELVGKNYDAVRIPLTITVA